jgi:predicted HAD superfamily Cof-like phosphohydrolase
MNKQLRQVKQFHKKFGVNNLKKNPGVPEDNEIILRRHRLIREEFLELQAEMMPTFYADVDKVAKEMADLLYVVYGAVLEYGLENKMKKVFSEVHKSNMSKLGRDGNPVRDRHGKVLKGPDYKPANISKILKINKNEQEEII